MSDHFIPRLSADRRHFISYFTTIGLSSTLFPGVLWAKAQERNGGKITRETLIAAEEIAGIAFSDAQRDAMLEGVNGNLQRYDDIRRVHIDISVPPALRFSPVLPGMRFDTQRRSFRPSRPPSVSRPADLEEVAFWPVTHQSQLIRSRRVRSIELTEMYLDRLKRFDTSLKCVVTLTEELALKQARQADLEIRAGRYRGPLHGIPWGAKDLLSARGYRTTWGAAPFKDQVLDVDATVVRRLADVGAVLVAKLATGELAHDDIWFGGQTKNPWNLEEGSGGSSAGSAAATAAGLVGFAIGTETGGSMVLPATRCGVTALRPTFGRVSRHGVMPGAWSFDKVGPMCRAVEDCALAFNAIHGPDGMDLTVVDLPFNWDVTVDVRKLRVGYLKAAFEEKHALKEEEENDERVLQTLRSLRMTLRPVELPALPIESALLVTWFGEISAVWDEMIRTGDDRRLTRQDNDHIGNLCRMTRMVPAVDYVQSSRLRTLIMEAMARSMADIDVYVAPYSRNEPGPAVSDLNLLLTNGTGYPAMVIPNGVTSQGSPTGIMLVGKLYGEADLLAVAKAFQDATGFHTRHPRLA